MDRILWCNHGEVGVPGNLRVLSCSLQIICFCECLQAMVFSVRWVWSNWNERELYYTNLSLWCSNKKRVREESLPQEKGFNYLEVFITSVCGMKQEMIRGIRVLFAIVRALLQSNILKIVKPKGKALSLLVQLQSDPHLYMTKSTLSWIQATEMIFVEKQGSEIR